VVIMTEEPGGSITDALTPEGASMHPWFSEVALHKLLGLQVTEWGADHVTVEMPVREAAFNSTGNLHGGSIATLIDVAAGTAAAIGSGFQPGKQTIVTADLHVRYLGRPRGDVVRAHARVVKAGRQLIVVECQVRDPQDRLVAVADFSSMIVPLREPLKATEITTQTDPDL
jgi:uncharacterized protein (TIGR00369 family)